MKIPYFMKQPCNAVPVLVVACWALVVVLAGALTPNSIITAQTPNRGVAQFLNADSPGTYKILYTAGPNGSKCTAVWVVTTDTVPHSATLQFVNSTTSIGSTTTGGRGGATLTTNVSAGNTVMSTPQSLLQPTVWPGLPLDSDGNPYIELTSADSLQVTFGAAITGGSMVAFGGVCVDF